MTTTNQQIDNAVPTNGTPNRALTNALLRSIRDSAESATAISAAQIEDSTPVGRAVLTADNQAAALFAIGAGTSNFSGSYNDLEDKPDLTFPDHQHPLEDLTQSGATVGQAVVWNGTIWAPATVSGGSGGPITSEDIEDSTTIGRAMLTAEDQEAMIAIIGTLPVGPIESDDITDSTVIGRSILTAADQASVAAIVGSLPVGPIESDDITDSTSIGRAILTAADQAAVVSIIGTGTAGKSAYEIAVDYGFNGTEAEWIVSLKGDKGNDGDIGPQGVSFFNRRIQTILASATSGAVTCNWNNFDEIRVTLDANTTLTFIGGNDGQGCTLKLKQDATGTRTLTMASSVRFNADIVSYTTTAAANKADRLGFIYDSADNKYDFVSVIKGF